MEDKDENKSISFCHLKHPLSRIGSQNITTPPPWAKHATWFCKDYTSIPNTMKNVYWFSIIIINIGQGMKDHCCSYRTEISIVNFDIK